MRLIKLLKLLKEDEYIVLTKRNNEIIDSDWSNDYKLLKRYKKHRKLKVVNFYYNVNYLIVEVKWQKIY